MAYECIYFPKQECSGCGRCDEIDNEQIDTLDDLWEEEKEARAEQDKDDARYGD